VLQFLSSSNATSITIRLAGGQDIRRSGRESGGAVMSLTENVNRRAVEIFARQRLPGWTRVAQSSALGHSRPD
jgi:hypothetical protein